MASFVLTVMVASSIQAGVISFVANPTTNSSDWTNSVVGLGGIVNTNVNFDAHPAGLLNNLFYSASDGVTFSTTGPTNTVQFGAGPGQTNTSSSPTSPGEGVHPASNYVFANSSPSTFTVNFAGPVLGAGLFVIDLFNPGSQPSARNPVTLSAYTGQNGTGTLLGTFNAAQFNFQPNSLYFMGIVSTDADIGSILLTNPGAASDQIGIDNVRFAQAVPEPGTLVLCVLGSVCTARLSRSRRKLAA